MTMAAKSFLLPEEDPELRRWLMAAAFVTAAHGGLVLWLMNKHDANHAGTPPAAIMIELAPLEVTPGPQMTQAEPEEVEPPQNNNNSGAASVPETRGGPDDTAEAKAKTEESAKKDAEALTRSQDRAVDNFKRTRASVKPEPKR